MNKPIINNNCAVLVAIDKNRNVIQTACSPVGSLNVDNLRNDVARLLEVPIEKVRIDSSACSFALLVFAPNAMRLAEDLRAKIALQLPHNFCFRAPHYVVVGGYNFPLEEKHARVWRRLMTTNLVTTNETVSPVITPYSEGRMALYFIDKRIASRAINRCFHLTPPCVTPNEITVDGTQYTFDCNWGKSMTPTSSVAVSSQSSTAPSTNMWAPNVEPLVSAVPSPSQDEQKRAFVFHDAENCWLTPSSSGTAMYANVVESIKQGMGQPDDQGLLVTWNFVLKSSGVHSSHFRPSSRAIEDLRDLGVTMIDPGNKDGAVDATIKEMLRVFLAIWRVMTPKAQENTVFVLISGDRDFAHELRELAEAGARVLLLSGHNVRPVLTRLAWKHSSAWSQMITA